MSNITVFESLKEVNGVKMMSSQTLTKLFGKEHRFIVATIRNTLESLVCGDTVNPINSRYYIEQC